jgi:hypothetical protein
LSLEEGVRQDLERRVGLAVPESVWAFLVERGKVAAVLVRQLTLDELTREFWAALKLSGLERKLLQPPPMLTAQQRERAADHQAVLAILLAREAAAEAAVGEFRKRVLSGTLLTTREAGDWLRRQAQVDGKPTVWLEDVAVPSGYEVRRIPHTWAFFTEPGLTISAEHPCHAESRMLVCAFAEQAPVALLTRAGGILEELRVLGQRLARQFAWSPMQATSFVLTGDVPALPLIRTWTEYSGSRPGCTRIVLEVDPTATPRLVAEQYRQVRRTSFTRRIRNLRLKALKLAAFAAQQPAETVWVSRMKAWNRKHAKSRYTRVSNFKRDCLQAQRRLLTLGERPRRRPGDGKGNRTPSMAG